jgi:thymidine kinase
MHIHKLRILAIASLSLAYSFAAQAECTFPKAPASIPDGKTASEAEMIAAMNAFKAYNEEVNAFGACLDDETKAKSVSSAQVMQLKTMQAKKHNAAVAELQDKAKAFNEQVRLYKSRG